MSSPTIVDIPADQRLSQISAERCSKGHLYVCEDMHRKQLIVIAQRMRNIQECLEVLFPCENVSLASLYEASDLKLRKGKTGAWSVRKLAPDEAPTYLDEKRRLYARTVIATTNPIKWHLHTVASHEHAHEASCEEVMT
jgi:hypothetical protein